VSFGAVFPAQYVPASHVAQTGGELEVAGAVCTVPALQVPAVVHCVWFG
jgi:hypothetical protein